MDAIARTNEIGERIMRYISLQDLIDHGKELRFQSAEQMAKVYEQLPSTEIIRCKDCKHNYLDGIQVRFNRCELNHSKVHGDDWFCADGERKE